MTSLKSLGFLSLALVSSLVHAQSFTLTSGTSEANFFFGAASIGELRDWKVFGQDGVGDQGFWYSPDLVRGYALNHSSSRTFTQTASDRLQVRYTPTGLDIKIDYLLTGSPGTISNLSQVATITNTGAVARQLYFFFFSDLGMRGAPGDIATALNSSTVAQHDQAFPSYQVTTGVTGIPDSLAVGQANAVFNAMSVNANLAPYATTFGPGDAQFAFRYTVQLEPGQSWQMSSNQIYTVPEPASLSALGFGLLAVLRRGRKSV